MLNYYKASYPSPPNKNQTPPPIRKVKSPVLIIHGLKDTALPAGMINNNWDYIDNELTIYTIPNAGHFVQQEAHKKVNKMIKIWLEKE